MQEAAAQPRGPALETPGQIWLKETMQVLHNGARNVWGPLRAKRCKRRHATPAAQAAKTCCAPCCCKPQQLQAHTWPAVATCRTRGSLEGGPGVMTAATMHSCAPNQLAAHAAQPAHTQEKAQTLCRAGTPKPSAHYRRAHQVSQASCLFASPTSTTHYPHTAMPATPQNAPGTADTSQAAACSIISSGDANHAAASTKMPWACR
jgi:hypothetical protein